MKKHIGVYIDHKRAIIIIVRDGDEKAMYVSSGLSQAQGSNNARNVIRDYYQRVKSLVRDADELYIFGPADPALQFVREMCRNILHPRIKRICVTRGMTEMSLLRRVRMFLTENSKAAQGRAA